MNRTSFLKKIQEAASYGLLEEVRTTPKPGLVDLKDSGAHKDMCYATFQASTQAVVPHLTLMAAAGYDWDGSIFDLFPQIRPIGVQAEQAMFQATGGVNTHKGMIFSLGIICAAMGYLYSRELPCSPWAVLETCGDMTRMWLEKDFEEMKRRPARTHGERLFEQYGYRGIRGEAQEGFPNLRLLALPAMKEALALHPDKNRARLKVLLTLMSQVDDTNILTRSDPQTLAYVKLQAQNFLQSYPIIDDAAIQVLQEMNQDFIRRNISPGGCADLLAISIFFFRLKEDLNEGIYTTEEW